MLKKKPKRKPNVAKTCSKRGSTVRPSDLTVSCSINEEPSTAYGSRLASSEHWSSLDLFCGAGGITEGFRRAGFECLYANDINHWAIQTFRANHPTTLADDRPIEEVDARALRTELGVRKNELDVLVGVPRAKVFQSTHLSDSLMILATVFFGITCDFSTSSNRRFLWREVPRPWSNEDDSVSILPTVSWSNA